MRSGRRQETVYPVRGRVGVARQRRNTVLAGCRVAVLFVLAGCGGLSWNCASLEALVPEAWRLRVTDGMSERAVAGPWGDGARLLRAGSAPLEGRRAGLAETGSLGLGPLWCWLTVGGRGDD